MMLDVRNLCSDEQSLAQVVGTYLCDRSIARGNTSTDQFGNILTGDVGKSAVPIIAHLTEAVLSAGAATVEVQLVSADDEGLTTNLVVHQSSGAIPKATLVLGYEFQLGKMLPVGMTKACWGFRYLVAGATITAGKITAGVCAARQTAPGM